ncbi:hypothetical protein [Amycolatopsis sp. BJA-103]|uniref:hypothetical protein n=1 Tax=Amycolatopsis sp. BJA-103 TaxID=1911175 RepID=UPI0011AED962|nr:hypothetical protein [Amycolatopsis sp. BJA-103]
MHNQYLLELTKPLAVFQAPSSTSTAPYILLGAGITAVVSIASIYLKFQLDKRVTKTSNEFELEKLKIELSANQEAANEKAVRQVYARFLAGTADIYSKITSARRVRRSNSNDEAYRNQLRQIDPREPQVALEEGRIIGKDTSAEAADALWHHVRSSSIPQGAELSSIEWKSWKDKYWVLRKALIDDLKSRPSTS